jgi:predicted transcriptional regulator
MTQQELSKSTGIAQPDISKYLKQIKQGDLFRKPILKILEVQGKGDLVRVFVKKINGEVK